MKVIEVHWSDEREESWYFARRVGEGQSDEAALKQTRDDYQRRPFHRFGDLITPTFRVRDTEARVATSPR